MRDDTLTRPFAIWLALAICWCTAPKAQTPLFRQHETKDIVLPSFYCMFQDSKGWMWFGGKSGLFRYDGLSFYELPLDSSFSGHISALFEWKGELWAGFSSGAIGRVPLSKLALGVTGAFVPTPALMSQWVPEEGQARKPVTSFAADLAGNLWFGTYGEGLYCFTGRRIYHFDHDDGMGSDEVYTVLSDSKGRIWAATDAGISICSLDSASKKTVRRLMLTEGLPDEIVTALATDKAGNIWIGMYEQGVCRYNTRLGKIDWASQNWAFGTVKSLCVFESGMVWVGTEKDGLVQIEPTQSLSQALPNGHPLRHLHTLGLLKDREGLLWSLSEKGKIHTANVQFGTLSTSLSNTQAVLATRDGHLWAGGPEGIVVLERKNGSMFKCPAPIRNVLALWESPSDGCIWAGTFDHGVFVLDAKGRVTRSYTVRDGLFDNNVLSISGDSVRVFLATLGGVMTIDLKNKKMEPLEGLGNKYVYKVLCDRSGRVWFGTDGNGLLVWDSGRLRRFEYVDGKPIRTVFSITEDARGDIWFFADKLGLLRCDGQKIWLSGGEKYMQRNAGIALGIAANGLVAVAYEDGFDLLNPNRLGHVTHCTPAIGAPKVGCNLNAVSKDADGHLWVGIRGGLLRLAAISEQFLDDPQLDIVSVSVLSELVDYLKVTTFAHDRNYFVFHFKGLWYTQPEAVSYRYRLDGFDPDWKISKDHLASYPRLPPGRYTFYVQTSEHGNFESAPERSWAFTVQSPIWQRAWFVVLTASLLAWGGWQLLKNRERRLAQEAQLKRENIVSQYEALKSHVSPHFLFNSLNTLIAIIEENPKVAVEYVEHLSDFFRKVMTYRDQDFISLQEERDLVRDYFYLLSKRYENNIVLIDRLDGHTGQVVPFSLQLLIENAVKHNVIAHNKPLILELFVDIDHYVVVRNNLQPKLRPEPSTRYGLYSLVSRYKLLGERPVLTENDNNTFMVKIPLRHEQKNERP